ncbi:DUF2927 domain-containing protein [Aureimonas sp. AU20]|uniref:DUF2927 domain-containing protein n=1 Tax=Aureimonas sp. AU20 TaxID=1349819 RepID=UPI0007214AEC|nr:DUF2927 domain-containing protein [Aureimonas sp. AU20]ALN72348.1 hypothetical protein M673_06455 [Aureimonas sp. AU20]
MSVRPLPFRLLAALTCRTALLLAFGLALLLGAQPARAQRLPGDEAMIRGFEAVVFGAEITGPLSDSSYLKKFAAPVRVRVENPAEIDRKPAVATFVRQLARQVKGLDIAMAGRGEPANFVVHVVDRDDYQRTGRAVYHRPFGRTPGNCIVRSSYGRAGITRSDAIIVSDEGDLLFRRCLIEEVLQGLGPLNDNTDAPQSVFNDTSKLTSFTPYDRLLVNMLYDSRLRPGMSLADAEPLLPAVLRDNRRRLGL